MKLPVVGKFQGFLRLRGTKQAKEETNDLY